MVVKCANPSCGVKFRYLRGGKLFLLEMPPFVPDGRGKTPGKPNAVHFDCAMAAVHCQAGPSSSAPGNEDCQLWQSSSPRDE